MVKIAFISDPISEFNIKKDSTYMMMLSASEKSWQIFSIDMKNMFIKNGVAFANTQEIKMKKSVDIWYEISDEQEVPLDYFDVIVMRKDPPFDMQYIHSTYMLDLALKSGVLVINNPQALRDYNEKVAITNFPNLSPKTLITSNYNLINRFLDEHKDIIAKPLDGMGGSSIFRIKIGDSNKNVILETLTEHQNTYIMLQNFEKDIVYGDKRILIVNGIPVDYLMARIPDKNDGRGNLAAGATAEIRKLNEQEYNIANKIGVFLKSKGVLFAGIDVIGNSLTEINITSPTGIQEIYKNSGINAADIFIQTIENIILKN